MRNKCFYVIFVFSISSANLINASVRYETKKCLFAYSNQGSGKRVAGTGLILGAGPKGIVTMEDKKTPTVTKWKTIRAFAFEQNSVAMKWHEVCQRCF